MMLAATWLFGSLARDEQAEGSDTDLLMVNLDDETKHVSVGHLSLFTYSWRQLESDARSGDLFVCHLVREAKPLLDPEDYLAKLRHLFVLRATYRDEIERAVDLGWYLVLFGADLGPSLLAKRALWCVRTILIARSAERRAPIFAPGRLAASTGSLAAREILGDRRGARDGLASRQLLRAFLDAEAPLHRYGMLMDQEAFRQRFDATSNKVALRTLLQEEQSNPWYEG